MSSLEVNNDIPLVEELPSARLYSENDLREMYINFAQALLPKVDEWATEAMKTSGASSRYYFLGPGTSTWPEPLGG